MEAATEMQIVKGEKPSTSWQKYPQDFVDFCLWMMALEGGSASRAITRIEADLQLKEHPYHEVGVEVGIPARGTLDYWRKTKFRNRFTELVTLRAKEMDDQLATEAQELAVQIGEAERQAVKRTMAGLQDLDGYQASQALRNLSQAKSLNMQQAREIRLAPAARKQAETLESIAASLNRLAGGAVVQVSSGEEIRDAVVVEDSEEDGDAVCLDETVGGDADAADPGLDVGPEVGSAAAT
jgi:hypothetical protein